MSSLDVEKKAVMTLNVPSVDKSREFEGLSNLKMKKKERHMKTLRDFSRFLETTNESVVQNVLKLSRDFRETMEVLDEELVKFCSQINEPEYLIPKSEKDLINILETELKVKIANRNDIVEKFAVDLDHTETVRADITGNELKRLVDQLIAIAHQLPDDIEHIVEAEAFELNTEIITNKNAHTQTMATHQIRQVVIEAESLQKWEDCREKWRQLRHEKALNDFRTHIASPEFTDPSDRQVFMKRFRAGQESREKEIHACLDRLQELKCDDINADAVVAVQGDLGELNVDEINAIQSCYNDLIRLQGDTAYSAAQRVEDLRRELHVYGALKIEPDLLGNSDILQSALDDERLSELWRLGGGLKPEFQAQVSDLRNPDVVYDRVVIGMRNRLETIISSFSLKSVLEERGRLAQLEKVRGFITKMRTAPRAEVAGVLKSMLPDLRDVEEIEQIPELFKENVRGIIAEMEEELASVEARIAAGCTSLGATGQQGLSSTQLGSSATLNASNSKTGGLRGTQQGGTGVTLGGATSKLNLTGNVSSATSLGATGGGMSRTKKGDASVAPVLVYADPNLVKGWNRKLGILYFGSDLPIEYQQGCLQSLELVQEQLQCNALVDAVVLEESAVKLVQLDKRYKKLTDSITTYLETQASMVAQAVTNIGDFFLCTAKMVEAHRAMQKKLDDKSADEIWDLKEEFRFEREDNEAAYEAACQKIREATKQEDLQMHFEEVLTVLEGIQQSYRNYHSNACFANDRYPLMLIHDFREYIATVAKNFFLAPDEQHKIVTEYERIFDQTIRFNRKYFDENPLAGGVERIPLPGPPPTPTDGQPSSNSDESVQEGEQGAAVGEERPEKSSEALAPIELLSPYLRKSTEPPGVCVGKYYWLQTFDSVVGKFKNVEGAFAVSELPPPAEAAAAAAATEGTSEEGEKVSTVAADGTAEAGAETNPSAAPIHLTTLIKEPHPQCPFVTSTCPRLPITADELSNLDADDRADYEQAISKHFIDLGDPADIPAEPEEPVKPVKGKVAAAPVEEKPPHPLSKLDEDGIALYVHTKEVAIETKKRLAKEAEPSFVLAHPPLDPRGESWIRIVEITAELIKDMVAGIRDSIISALEKETYKRVSFAEKQAMTVKDELTDQLEDQIRNHWPRRGRVETQIKQPREAELLGHKEKTWRHINSIQSKMIAAQEKFGASLDKGKEECNSYVNDMAALRNSLSGDFKNLAFLQAIDVKARGVTIDFQANSSKRTAILTQIAEEETSIIASYARDFRKICPAQVPGVEGGYSEIEILEIEAIVEGQCAEIEAISAEWAESIKQLEEEQSQSAKCQEEFAVRYKKATQDVAMSEGLGQKYGAPRRRAQERIRTEVGRDERCAGKLDALLAKLEFACAEAERKAKDSALAGTLALSTVSAVGFESPPETTSAPPSMFSLGEEELYHCTMNWNYLVQVRLSIQQRVKYLRVCEGALPELASLPWMNQDRIALCAAVGADNGAAELEEIVSEDPPMTLEAVFEDVDKTCRKETKDLYESEGLGSVLGAGGVPDALQSWLEESREKLLGRNGHREKSWKRLWSQVARSEEILARHLIPAVPQPSDPSKSMNLSALANEGQQGGDPDKDKADGKYITKLGVPAVCLRSLATAFIDFAQKDKDDKIQEFSKLLKVWEKGREKHERQLRPRLGAPDMAEELAQLDSIESQRSAELVENVGKFRTMLVRMQTNFLQSFLDDVAVCGTGFIQLLDSTLRQEQLQVPPDTEVPKKHMTLKKLRKAQRIREIVAQGGEDRSQARIWDGIDMQLVSDVVRSAEDMVLDLGTNPKDTAVTLSAAAAAAAAAAPPDKKDAKKAPAKGAAPPPETPAVAPSLIPPSWAEALTERSTTKGLVSTAHRAVISERNAAVARFTQYLAGTLEDLRGDYDTILQQEASWNERWRRQVQMLQRGNL